MRKEYSKYESLFVQVKHPKMPKSKARHGALRNESPTRSNSYTYWSDDAWDRPVAIILYTGTHVWVDGDCRMLGHPEAIHVRVNTTRAGSFDEDGNCIIAVPIAWCIAFYSQEEAETVMRCMDEDEKLLRYAL